MCGRFTYWDSETITNQYHCIPFPDSLSIPANYNACPNTPIPVITSKAKAEKEVSYQLQLMYWGLIPSWAKPEEHRGFINARSETISTKKSFKESFMLKRCIIPARGYYEWCEKQPYFISKGQHLAFAGIWNAGSSNVSPSVAIITKAAQHLSHIHERFPVTFTSDDPIQQWLYPTTSPTELLNLVEQCNDEDFISYQVSPQVSSPKNNFESLLNKI